jgi:hypothetical protein
MSDAHAGFPIGLVGRVIDGPNAGLYIEVDDDTQRPGGTGGFYVLLWDTSVGYDEWYESSDGVVLALRDRRVEWLSEAESAAVPGRHGHDSN